MKDLGELMQQMQQVQERMQQELTQAEVTGEAGGGLVRVTMSGKGDVRDVSIDDSLLTPEEKEIVEDLLVAAFNQARERAEALIAEKMQQATGGLPLPPGFSL